MLLPGMFVLSLDTSPTLAAADTSKMVVSKGGNR